MEPVVKLSGINWLAAFAHFASLVLLIVAYVHWKGSKHSEFDLYRYQIEGPTTSGADLQCKTVPQGLPKPTLKLNVIVAVMLVFAITVAAHVFYATDAFGSKAYTKAIKEGWNPFRWVEYALSASIMIAAIGTVDGTVDTPTILLLFISTMALMFNGYASESALRGKGPLSAWASDSVKGSTVSGWLLFVGIWSVIAYNFIYVVSDVNDLYADTLDPQGKKVHVPSWLWYIILMQFLYFLSFGIVQFFQMRNRQKIGYEYIKYERYYINLSFFSKLSLASGLGYGILFKGKDCD